MKINLGSNNKRVDGYINVDALDLENVDVVHDLTIFPYPFKDNSAAEIISIEFLEHISFKYTNQVLRECYRILAPGGRLIMQVPDIGAMCSMYHLDLICDCVPRKAAQLEEFKAKPDCQNCQGKAVIHPERWRVAFSGAQKHDYDNHLAHFTKDILIKEFWLAGFNSSMIGVRPHIYKLIVEGTK